MAGNIGPRVESVSQPAWLFQAFRSSRDTFILERSPLWAEGYGRIHLSWTGISIITGWENILSGEIEAAGYSSWFVNCLNSLRRSSGGQVLSWHLTDCPLCPKHGPETHMDPRKYKPLHDLVLGFNLDWHEVSTNFTDLPECTPQTWFSVIYERGEIAATPLTSAVAFLLLR